jgi:hypothetical protein
MPAGENGLDRALFQCLLSLPLLMRFLALAASRRPREEPRIRSACNKGSAPRSHGQRVRGVSSTAESHRVANVHYAKLGDDLIPTGHILSAAETNHARPWEAGSDRKPCSSNGLPDAIAMVQIGADKECRLRVGWHGAMDGNRGRRNFSLFMLHSNRIGGAFRRYKSRGNGIRGFRNS